MDDLRLLQDLHGSSDNWWTAATAGEQAGGLESYPQSLNFDDSATDGDACTSDETGSVKWVDAP